MSGLLISQGVARACGEEIERIRKLREQYRGTWPAVWLEQRGLDQAALRWKTFHEEENACPTT